MGLDDMIFLFWMLSLKPTFSPMYIMKRKKDRTLKDELLLLLEISGEITPERKKRQSKSKNNTQLWMWLVMEVKSNAVKSNIA